MIVDELFGLIQWEIVIGITKIRMEGQVTHR